MPASNATGCNQLGAGRPPWPPSVASSAERGAAVGLSPAGPAIRPPRSNVACADDGPPRQASACGQPILPGHAGQPGRASSRSPAVSSGQAGAVRRRPGPLRRRPGRSGAGQASRSGAGQARPLRRRPGRLRRRPGPLRRRPGPLRRRPGPLRRRPGPLRRRPGPHSDPGRCGSPLRPSGPVRPLRPAHMSPAAQWRRSGPRRSERAGRTGRTCRSRQSRPSPCTVASRRHCQRQRPRRGFLA